MPQKFITGSELAQAGRPQVEEPQGGPSSLRYTELIFATADPLDFNFPNALATNQTFGVVRSIFVNNKYNDYDITIVVGGTLHTFVVNAGSQGYYDVDAQLNSNIIATTAGDSAGPVSFRFYNYNREPIVWYEQNPTSITAAVTIGDGDDVAQGSTTDIANTNSATNGTLIAFTKGIVSLLNTINTALGSFFSPGAIIEAGTLTITAGGVVQTVFAANLNRKVLGFVNGSTNNMRVRFGANATATVGILVGPGGAITLANSECPTDSVTVYGITTGDPFYAWYR